MSKRYHYTRDGHVFTVGSNGVTVVDDHGRVTVDVTMDVPPDVIASTVIDLTLAGWVWQNVPGD